MGRATRREPSTQRWRVGSRRRPRETLTSELPSAAISSSQSVPRDILEPGRSAMAPRFGTPLMISTFLLLAFGTAPARADGPAKKAPEATRPAPEGARKAVERGLAFLQADAARWREERKCATCHHGTMTLWALSEARS